MIRDMAIQPAWSGYAREKETNKSFNRTTILDSGSGQYVGILGEIALGIFLQDSEIPFQHCGFTSYEYDFLVDGIKVDVKTKACNTEPLPHYTVHVTESQKDRDCDLYVFCRASPSTLYLLGWMEKPRFWAVSTNNKRGQSDNTGFVEKADARTLIISDLNGMETLANTLNQKVPTVPQKRYTTTNEVAK